MINIQLEMSLQCNYLHHYYTNLCMGFGGCTNKVRVSFLVE